MNKLPEVEALVQMKPDCDKQWHVYMALGIALWLILVLSKGLKPRQRKLLANKVHIHVFLGNYKHCVPMRLISIIGNPTVRGTLQKTQTTITKHLIWDTLYIN